LLGQASRLQGGYRTQTAAAELFGFFVDCVLVAVGTEFVQFQPGGGVTTVFHRGIAVHTIGTLIGIAATFGTF
jgi:hypothetical protein